MAVNNALFQLDFKSMKKRYELNKQRAQKKIKRQGRSAGLAHGKIQFDEKFDQANEVIQKLFGY